MPKQTPAVLGLIIANAILFVLTYMVPGNQDAMLENMALFHPSDARFAPWQFLTSLFMHGSFTHIFFNLFAVHGFGSVLESRWGAKRFLSFYFAAGLGAGIIHVLVNTFQQAPLMDQLTAAGLSEKTIALYIDAIQAGFQVPLGEHTQTLHALAELFRPVVGASGAVYGILVAFACLHPNAKLMLIFLPVPVAAKYFVPALLLFDLFSGVTGFQLFSVGIAHFAHLGGALIGFLLMLLWRKSNRSSDYDTPFAN